MSPGPGYRKSCLLRPYSDFCPFLQELLSEEKPACHLLSPKTLCDLIQLCGKLFLRTLLAHSLPPEQHPEHVPRSPQLCLAQGAHRAPCTSPFVPHAPSLCSGHCRELGASARRSPGTVQLSNSSAGCTHSSTGSAGRGNSSQSHPGAAGSCILGERGEKAQQTSK